MVMVECCIVGIAAGEQIGQQVEYLLLVERIQQTVGHDGERRRNAVVNRLLGDIQFFGEGFQRAASA